MKKFLVILLALAMVLGVATTAMAADTQIPDYSDTNTATKYAVDVYRLTALGVLEGNTGWGGAYRPTENLTRAEFAKIACFMFGKQDYVAYYAAQKSAFSDVPEGHWAEGWINCAYDNGLMVGVGNGKFNPASPVTKQEVATVTLRAVGYTDALPGAWPADYIAKSQKVHTWLEDEYKDELSLFQYVEKIDGTVATRAEMAAIVNYCLDLRCVEYVGNQVIVANLGGENSTFVDADGYRYKGTSTNERRGYDDLLWTVFKAWVDPDWQFKNWTPDPWAETEYNRYVEASGWGYEDLEKNELLFDKQPDGAFSVASDYYIFDPFLDGQLWQLGHRYAFLTVLENKDAEGEGEVLFAELTSDVKYIDEKEKLKFIVSDKLKPLLDKDNKMNVENSDVFVNSDGKNYDFYKYDWFAKATIGIISEVEDDKVLVDMVGFGEPDDGDWIFCKLDGCDTHEKNYVFLKDGKLQDASCLKLNDVVYRAGLLSASYAGEDIELYLVYTPQAAKLEELINVDKQEAASISGEDYKYFSETPWSNRVSYNDGYEDGGYEAITYDGLEDRLEEECLFVPGYGKKYVATLIFKDNSTRKFGVLTKLDLKQVPPNPDNWYATGGEVLASNGEKDTFTLKDDVNVGNDGSQSSENPDPYWGDKYLGWLGNYWPDEDGEIDWAATEKHVGDVAKADSDVGYVPFDPAMEAVTLETNSKGALKDPAAAFATSTRGYNPAGLRITEDTIIFEVTTKKGKAIDPETGDEIDILLFKEAKLGSAAKYIGKEFSVKQFDVFEKDGKNIKVLYVVDPKLHGGTLLGMFDTSRVDGDGGFAKFMDDGTKIYFTDNQGRTDLDDADKVYAAYKTQDDKVKKLYFLDLNTLANPEKLDGGDFVVLYYTYGLANDTSEVDVVKVIKKFVDGADSHDWDLSYNDLKDEDFASDCEFIDLTSGEDSKLNKEYFTGVSHDSDPFEFAATWDDEGNLIQVFRYYVGE